MVEEPKKKGEDVNEKIEKALSVDVDKYIQEEAERYMQIKGAMEQYVLNYAIVNGRLPPGGAFAMPSEGTYVFDLPCVGAMGGKLAQKFMGMQLNLNSLANYGAKMYKAGELDKEDEDIADRAPRPQKREHVWDAAMYA